MLKWPVRRRSELTTVAMQRVRAHVRKTARPALYLDEPEAMEREGGFEDVHVSAQRVDVGGLSAL